MESTLDSDSPSSKHHQIISHLSFLEENLNFSYSENESKNNYYKKTSDEIKTDEKITIYFNWLSLEFKFLKISRMEQGKIKEINEILKKRDKNLQNLLLPSFNPNILYAMESKKADFDLRALLFFLKNFKRNFESLFSNLRIFDSEEFKEVFKELKNDLLAHYEYSLSQDNFYKLIFKICYDCSQGLFLLHTENIAHLDIKPENIVVFLESPYFIVKIIDYGTAYIIKPGEVFYNFMEGFTKNYVAPERFNLKENEYSLSNKIIANPEKCDVFSLGKTIEDFIKISKSLSLNKNNPELCAKFENFFKIFLKKTKKENPSMRSNINEIVTFLENFLKETQIEKIQLFHDADHYLKSLPRENSHIFMNKNIKKIESTLQEIEKKNLFQLYFDLDFFEQLKIYPEINNKQKSEILMSYFKHYLDYSSSYFLDNISYYYEIYVAKQITLGLLYETLGSRYYNLGKFQYSILFYKRSKKEYEKLQKKNIKYWIDMKRVQFFQMKSRYFLREENHKIKNFLKKYKKNCFKNNFDGDPNEHFLFALYYELKLFINSRTSPKKMESCFQKSIKIRSKILGSADHPAILMFKLRILKEAPYDNSEMIEQIHEISKKNKFNIINFYTSSMFGIIYHGKGQINKGLEYFSNLFGEIENGNYIRANHPEIVEWKCEHILALEKEKYNYIDCLSELEKLETHFENKFNFSNKNLLLFYAIKIKFLNILKKKDGYDEIFQICDDKVDSQEMKHMYSNYIAYYYWSKATIMRDVYKNYEGAIKFIEKAKECFNFAKKLSWQNQILFCDVLKSECLYFQNKYEEALKTLELPRKEYSIIFSKENHWREKKANDIYEAIMKKIKNETP